MGIGFLAIILGIFGLIFNGLISLLGLALAISCINKSNKLTKSKELTDEEFQTDKKTLKGLGVAGIIINCLSFIWLVIKSFIF